MKIAGINKNSFVDMKGMIAYVVFTPGCNFDCWYCHNRHILGGDSELLSEDLILKDLQGRTNFIDIVVITGGEPTLQPDLEEFILKVKALGFPVKLDTNGSNPDMLKALLNRGLLHYVAMDIKAPYDRYEDVIECKADTDKIKESICIIRESGIDYEFRTTFSPDLNCDNIEEIAEGISGAKLYVLQQFKPNENIVNKHLSAHSPEYVREAAQKASKYVKVQIKGID